MLRHLDPNPDEVRRFLIESERRVVAHCRKLLEQEGLSFTERRRLSRVLGGAEDELQRLDPRLRVDAASKAVDLVDLRG
ncbi:hypothetical protein [Bradyrhizobium sp.]|uniref:hypothetical protein n=1 Tax=Bradyrhizobium sp. TaxID=376 RepID=UPI001DABD699|nr:hypothetical protein [Bradyrhizobium sp.]MBV8698177.1 hypothetical protein [Bradyrhizobium sp.]MBV8919201.1 hypothetical protein [Bradyrhizobium sp.]MBV9984620.1 hypothetical protein [Bradyrhizobium sp.]